MRSSARILIAVVVMAHLGSPLPAKADDAERARGLGIVETQCARCHAIGRSDSSMLAGAPPFRQLSKRYPLTHLAEAMAEGILTGHEAMPDFKFSVSEIDAILSYIASISDP